MKASTGQRSMRRRRLWLALGAAWGVARGAASGIGFGIGFGVALGVVLGAGFAGAAQAQAQPAVPAGNDIVVGQIAPFVAAPETYELHLGARACLDEANRRGGVRGRRINFFGIDDELKAELAVEKFNEAMARRPVALLNVVGSGLLGTLLSRHLLDTADVVLLGAIPGAEAFREPGHPRLFHIRSGDRAQLERILLHSRTLGVQQVHVLYQDVAVGQSGLAVLRAAAARLGQPSITATASSLQPQALAAAVRTAAAAPAQAYVLLGFPQFMAEALADLRSAGARQAVFALGYLTPEHAVRAAGLSGARGLGLTQALPNPNGKTLPLQREFQAAMDRSPSRAAQYTPFHLEGCVAARVLVEGLRRIEGPITADALAKSLHAMGEIDLGGYRVDFSNSQVGSVWSDIGVMSSNGRLSF